MICYYWLLLFLSSSSDGMRPRIMTSKYCNISLKSCPRVNTFPKSFQVDDRDLMIGEGQKDRRREQIYYILIAE